MTLISTIRDHNKIIHSCKISYKQLNKKANHTLSWQKFFPVLAYPGDQPANLIYKFKYHTIRRQSYIYIYIYTVPSCKYKWAHPATVYISVMSHKNYYQILQNLIDSKSPKIIIIKRVIS